MIKDPRQEAIFSGTTTAIPLSEGVKLREFANAACGAVGFSTGIVEFAPGAVLAYHSHPVSEAIVILAGSATVSVEGRAHHLDSLDCIHIPRDIPHKVENIQSGLTLIALSAFASNRPSRKLLKENHRAERNQSAQEPLPEHIVRSTQDAQYELAPGAWFIDLFAGRFGSVGICGGYGRFSPGSSLPCHIHEFDESISIIEGEAVCLAQGKRYALQDNDTAFIPRGRPHRFLNLTESPMAMIWVYAGSDPERKVVESAYCDGTSVWP